MVHRATVLLAAAALAVTGCSAEFSVGNTGLDIEKLTQTIQADVDEILPEGVTATVACPPDIPQAAGTNFTCTVMIGEQQLSVRVTQKDDEGNVDYKQEQAVLDLALLESELNTELDAQLTGSWQTSCEPVGTARAYVVAPGEDFECYATGETAQGQSAEDLPIIVTVKNVDGEITWTTKE